MKHVSFYLIGAVVFAGVIYAEQALAMPIAVQSPILMVSPVEDEVPKDGIEKPAEGAECEEEFPACEVHRK